MILKPYYDANGRPPDFTGDFPQRQTLTTTDRGTDCITFTQAELDAIRALLDAIPHNEHIEAAKAILEKALRDDNAR